MGFSFKDAGKMFTGGLSGSDLFGDKNPTSTSNSSTDVLEWAKPYYSDILKRQSDLSKRAWTPYSGTRFASPLSQNSLFSGAANMYRQAMSDPLDNPYYTAMSGRMASDFAKGTAAQTDAAAARSGAFGSSGWSAAQADNARALGDSLAQLQGQMYQQGLNAAGQAANLAQADQADQQQRLDFVYQQWLEQKGWDQNQINNFANVLQSLVGNRGTQQGTSTAPNPNRAGGLIGDLTRTGNMFNAF
jgi:hypothetical protein